MSMSPKTKKQKAFLLISDSADCVERLNKLLDDGWLIDCDDFISFDNGHSHILILGKFEKVTTEQDK